MFNRPPVSADDIQTFVDQFTSSEEAIKAIKELTQQRQPTGNKPTIDPSAPLIISTENLTKTYKVGRAKVEALKDVSIDIHQGEFIALTGPSGSGKSTLLQLIGGLDKPSSGKINVNGVDIAKLSDAKLSNFRNQTIGFVFQFFYLQPFLSLERNIEVAAMFAGAKRSERRKSVASSAQAVSLSDRIRHMPSELSGGQMQRVAIARALLNKPRLLLADEPTGNLDSKTSAQIIDLFEKIRQKSGTTIVVVTHDPVVAAKADREIKLADGALL